MFLPGDKVQCIDDSESVVLKKYGYAGSLRIGTLYCVEVSWSDPKQNPMSQSLQVTFVGEPPMPNGPPRDKSGKPVRIGWRANRFVLIHRTVVPPKGRTRTL
jgi:hypothetical protein